MRGTREGHAPRREAASRLDDPSTAPTYGRRNFRRYMVKQRLPITKRRGVRHGPQSPRVLLDFPGLSTSGGDDKQRVDGSKVRPQNGDGMRGRGEGGKEDVNLLPKMTRKPV